MWSYSKKFRTPLYKRELENASTLRHFTIPSSQGACLATAEDLLHKMCVLTKILLLQWAYYDDAGFAHVGRINHVHCQNIISTTISTTDIILIVPKINDSEFVLYNGV